MPLPSLDIGREDKKMKLKGSELKKVYIILLIVFICGITLQVSRSQFVLKAQENRQLIEQKDEILAMRTSNQITQKTGENYCILYNSDNEYSTKLKDNAQKSLEYMKKRTTEVNVGEYEKITLGKCHVTILTTDYLEDIGTPEDIEHYVFKGGYILLMSTLDIGKTSYQILYRKLGVSSFGDYVQTKGIHLVSNVLIGEKGLKFDNDFITNDSISVDLDDTAKLLAESAGGTPLLWRNEYGDGAFMVFNGTILQEKISRGFFTGALSLLEPNFIYSVFNEKLFYIDDFPAPIPKGKNASIYQEYKRDMPTFFNEIWWPNMLKTAKKYDLKYTGGIIESYTDRVTPPFNNLEDKDKYNLIAFGRELLKGGGEVGFHGFNHQSLTLDPKVAGSFGYNAWESEEDMSKSIKELMSYANNAFPNYKMASYIPPSNVLSQEGRNALKAAWPDLTVISSLYPEDITGLSYVQEFEIAKDGIIEMPRITSGYFERKYDRWAEANTMTGLGFFSHFVHPDDVISSDRSNDLGWREMYEKYDKYMSRVKKTYPWLRSMTSTDAALDVASTLQSQVKWSTKENSIAGHITNYAPNLYYIFRSDKKIKRLYNCELTKIDANTYLVEAKKADFKIDLGES